MFEKLAGGGVEDVQLARRCGRRAGGAHTTYAGREPMPGLSHTLTVPPTKETPWVVIPVALRICSSVSEGFPFSGSLTVMQPSLNVSDGSESSELPAGVFGL